MPSKKKQGWIRRKYGRHYEHELYRDGHHVATIYGGSSSVEWGNKYRVHAQIRGKTYGGTVARLTEAKKLAESIVRRYL